MKRALCLWLPHWPLQRLAAARAELKDRPVVLYELNASGGAKVAACCPHLGTAAAAPWQRGDLPDPSTGRVASFPLRPGMPLAEATALWQEGRLHLEMIDPASDLLAIEELAEWCHQFAPSVGLEESAAPESLLMDVSGLDRLFGERRLARRIAKAFLRRGLAARVALADTLAAAWAVAHYAPLEPGGADILERLATPLLVPPGEAAAVLAPLPPAALRLPDEVCGLLAELGIRRIEQLAALRRETLLARFGPEVLKRLDQARGLAPEAIVARPPSPDWSFAWTFEHPTARQEMVDGALAELIARACATLGRQGHGLLRLECRFEPERGPAARFVAGFYRPTADAQHAADMVRLKLERLRLAEPLAALSVRVLAIDRLEYRQREFFASQQNRDAPDALALLVDRLSNRLGPQAVVRPWLLSSAQPEFACQYRPLAHLSLRAREKKLRTPGKTRKRSAHPPGDSSPGKSVAAADRPLHLEDEPRPIEIVAVAPEGPPARFRHAGRDERIARSWGPERIETGWWRGACVRRDYYQVETAGGGRYWLFRELNSGRWFLHGTFC